MVHASKQTVNLALLQRKCRQRARTAADGFDPEQVEEAEMRSLEDQKRYVEQQQAWANMSSPEPTAEHQRDQQHNNQQRPQAIASLPQPTAERRQSLQRGPSQASTPQEPALQPLRSDVGSQPTNTPASSSGQPPEVAAELQESVPRQPSGVQLPTVLEAPVPLLRDVAPTAIHATLSPIPLASAKMPVLAATPSGQPRALEIQSHQSTGHGAIQTTGHPASTLITSTTPVVFTTAAASFSAAAYQQRTEAIPAFRSLTVAPIGAPHPSEEALVPYSASPCNQPPLKAMLPSPHHNGGVQSLNRQAATAGPSTTPLASEAQQQRSAGLEVQAGALPTAPAIGSPFPGSAYAAAPAAAAPIISPHPLASSLPHNAPSAHPSPVIIAGGMAVGAAPLAEVMGVGYPNIGTMHAAPTQSTPQAPAQSIPVLQSSLAPPQQYNLAVSSSQALPGDPDAAQLMAAQEIVPDSEEEEEEEEVSEGF